MDEASLGVLPRGASNVSKDTVLFKEIRDNIDIRHAGNQSSSRDGRFTEIIRGTMNRTKVETIKAVVMTLFAVLTALATVYSQDYSLAVIPALLIALSAWFWWKVNLYSKDEE